jgi:hypothetical protein
MRRAQSSKNDAKSGYRPIQVIRFIRIENDLRQDHDFAPFRASSHRIVHDETDNSLAAQAHTKRAYIAAAVKRS